MDEDTLADLKQFITAIITQHTSGLATKEELGLLSTKTDLERIEQKIDQIQEAVQVSAIGYTT